jgi:hypothetical protein
VLPFDEQPLPGVEIVLRHFTVPIEIHASIDGAPRALAVFDRREQCRPVSRIKDAVVVEITLQRIEADDNRIVIRRGELIGAVVTIRQRSRIAFQPEFGAAEWPRRYCSRASIKR